MRLHNHGLDDFKAQLADLQVLLAIGTLDDRRIAQKGTTLKIGAQECSGVKPVTVWLNLGQLRGHNFRCGEN